MSSNLIREILTNSKTIAVIGIKKSESQPAYKVPYYMKLNGYRIIPVNPKYHGEKILDEKVYSSVKDIEEEVDIVNIFRRPELLIDHAQEILSMKNIPPYVWFQLGINNDEAAKMLEEKGIKVVQNRCIMVEHTRL